ncbi:unnamed protein product [Schistosoma curassoni]|uniref:RT_RNaseH domain-containing protein n=1 Tax=Schistosoma curassoni TaxID=6186 RepID=A0A183KSA7_9TREM|nr:unnamed protein product [Schistosoma curassoni]
MKRLAFDGVMFSGLDGLVVQPGTQVNQLSTSTLISIQFINQSGKKFTIVTDDEALKLIYHPEKSLACSLAAMVQRWSIALSTYNYTVLHTNAKQIQHVDYISRQSLLDKPVTNSNC